MARKITEYFRELFGSPERVPEQVNGSSRLLELPLSQEERALIEARELLEVGIRFFQGGHQDVALEALRKVLDYPVPFPSLRMTAACLTGEIRRGLGDFRGAEQHYRSCVEESRAIPAHQRTGNQWYEHYRPRAQLGMITVLRRTLCPDHDRIRSLLLDARDEFRELPAPDLMAQLNVAEGLYERQLGRVDSGAQNLLAGIEGAKGIEPPFLFLQPEQFEALLALTCLCSPVTFLRASRIAKRLLAESRDRWSTGAATIALLHLNLRRLGRRDGAANELDDSAELIESLLGELKRAAEDQLDPYLLSELSLLNIVWGLLCGEKGRVLPWCNLLLDSTASGLPPLSVLRGVEVGGLCAGFSRIGVDVHSELGALFAGGREAIDSLEDRFESYGCDSDLRSRWRDLLERRKPDPHFMAVWHSKELLALRARALP